MAKDRKGFVYRGDERTTEDVSRRSKQSGGTYDSFIDPAIPMYKSKEGECTIRILPPTWEDVEKWGTGWEVGVTVHYGVGPDEGTYLCLAKMKGETCPVCEARRDAADADEADALRPGWRALCWIIDRDNEKAGPQVWSMPITMFRDINARSIDKKSGSVVKIDHPEKGYDVLFNREGSGLRTKYTAVEIDRESTPIHDNEKLQDRWLDYIVDNPLNELLNFFDFAYIEKVLHGKADSRRPAAEEEEPRRGGRRRADPAEEEEEAPRGRRRAPAEDEPRSTRRRAAPAEEEETDLGPRSRREGRRASAEEEPRSTRRRQDPPLEEEEEAPRTTRRRAAPAEEEEPAPTTRRRAAPAEEEPDEAPPPRRRAAAPAEEEDPPFDPDEPSEAARNKLGNLRRRRG